MNLERDRAQFNEDLLRFLQAAPSPFHCVAAMAERLEGQGFARLEEGEEWRLAPGARHYVVRNGSSLVAFVVGRRAPAEGGLRLVGAHTDSPCLVVKPNPELVRHGYLQLAVEVYGGALLNPWFDRDLSLAGRVVWRAANGSLAQQLVDFRRPVAVIPSLAIHLDRSANENRSINPQNDILPVLGLARDAPWDLRTLLAEEFRIPGPILDWELYCYDTQPPAVVGLRGEFIAAARLDNQLSCYAGLAALLEADGEHSCILVCNDHEEVGSTSWCGAQGPFLGDVLRRLLPDEQTRQRALARSLLVSTDNAHGRHPNFPDRHDDGHAPRLNGGPVIKVNARQRYATNALTAALFRDFAARAGVPVQLFASRNDMPCGSTIGPLTAAELGVATLDVGVPTFAMHSARELAGTADAHTLKEVLARFFNNPSAPVVQ
ncbi:MAG: putative M18 family aminopeptidase 2 [Porticoccaceae bacterium]|nr:MAG: putative M18 family aminopeptidase 2 [Porticoccaceae bacterium]